MKKTVCIIGKPNVGKSTIFNLLIKEKKSIIEDTPGITRDRIYGEVNYKDYSFLLIDTGGIESGATNFSKDIIMQANIAIDESDIIIFVIDGTSELTKDDYLVKDILIKSQKKVILVANKLDNEKLEENIYNYYSLGFPIVIGVSAIHNRNLTYILDEIISDMNNTTEEKIDNTPKFCIIGRPNVGKSSLINALCNDNRSIVSDIPGTTRDAIDSKIKYHNNEYIIIDTAGMRKKGKIYENIEKYSLIRSLKAIERSDVCVLVLNAEEGIIEHDKHIASYAINEGKGLVIVVNKWDLVNEPEQSLKKWKKDIQNNFQFASYVKIVFLSAKTKKRLTTLMPEIITTLENCSKEIKTSLLNTIIQDATSLHPAPSYKGKRLKIYFVSQTGIKPPKFTFNVNNKGLVHFSYERYLKNVIRENFDLSGTPIIIQFKNKDE